MFSYLIFNISLQSKCANSILQMRKLMFRKAKQFSQSYTNNKWQNQNLDLGFQVFYFPKAVLRGLGIKATWLQV